MGTSGQWSLVTDKDPDGYDESDYHWYTDLLHQTDALYQGFDRHTRYPRASRSKRWIKILRPIWYEIQHTDLNSIQMIVVILTNIMTKHRGRSNLKRQNKDIILICMKITFVVIDATISL